MSRAYWKIGDWGRTIALVPRGRKWYVRLWDRESRQPRYRATGESDFNKARAAAKLIAVRFYEEAGIEWDYDFLEDEQLLRNPDEVDAGHVSQAVYFIQSESNGFIKIGVAQDVQSRLAELQRMSPVPLRLIGTIPDGGLMLEATLHKLFQHCRVHGEWFRATPGLLEIVEHAACHDDCGESIAATPMTAGQRARPTPEEET